uniref:Ribosome binding protein 1a n=1 Tax=Gasterosteus aculeatus aculeatus TaxID=481459 RepID=G3NLP1_GASAC
MDIYDPQTLGIMVFGGFMVISALGIALVSTFSMKETSYEEALAKQRSELGKIHSARSDKKKKDKVSEKKGRGKKKEDKPNGKIPEPDETQEDVEADVVVEPAAAPVVAAAPEPERVPDLDVKPNAATAAPEPTTAPEPSPAVIERSPAPSPKEKKKKKVAKAEPASSQAAPLVVASAAVKSSSVPASNQTPMSSLTKANAPSSAPAKPASAPAKPASAPAKPAPAPAKPALVSTISSMVFSEVEAHRLIEILSEKVGIIQETWHKATQKGDPVAMLKKQLEEREKQLAAEQEESSAAKNRQRELAKELSAEKSKVASVETRLSSQLSKREQEMIALQARMQASYQDHVAQTQGLTAKVVSLQDQLEKGPNAQLARLQQENSILRDALNQATSQAESKQNAELAKLRQECAKLTKELGEKTEGLLADEHIRKGLEAKLSAVEKQLSLLQASHGQKELVLQRKLEEVCEELRETQSRNNSLQATLDNAQQDSSTLSEYQVRIGRLEADNSERSARVDALTAQLQETQTEKSQLEQQVASINSLLEANQTKKEEDDKNVVRPFVVGLTFLKFQLVTCVHPEGSGDSRPADPGVSVGHSVARKPRFYRLTCHILVSGRISSECIFALSQELLGKLKEAEEGHGSLQAECEQYRTVLAETEGMLKHLQKSVEEEELVWKSKMANSEEQLSAVCSTVSSKSLATFSFPKCWSPFCLKEQVMLLEAQLEKQSEDQATSEEIDKVKSDQTTATSLDDTLLLKM